MRTGSSTGSLFGTYFGLPSRRYWCMGSSLTILGHCMWVPHLASWSWSLSQSLLLFTNWCCKSLMWAPFISWSSLLSLVSQRTTFLSSGMLGARVTPIHNTQATITRGWPIPLDAHTNPCWQQAQRPLLLSCLMDSHLSCLLVLLAGLPLLLFQSTMF